MKIILQIKSEIDFFKVLFKKFMFRGNDNLLKSKNGNAIILLPNN